MPIESALDQHLFTLKRALKALDDKYGDYLREREAYVEAIAALEKGKAKNIVPKYSTSTEDAPAPLATSVVVMTRLKAINLAINSFNGNFTTSDVRYFVSQKYPFLMRDIRKSYIATRLNYLAKQGVIRITAHGSEGGANTWEKIKN